ncbi:MAG: PatB family C-S lyase [Candidatus Aminicenantes bacterium]|nr:PatB family C-S lyase [Candidatus Aminicenantes bacterium]
MDFNFDQIIDRRGTYSLKWDFLQEKVGDEEIIPLWVADMDFLSPPSVIDALRNRAAHGIYGYTGWPDSYYQSIIFWMKKRFSWPIEKEWIIFTPGVIPALHLAVQAFTQPGDKVIIQPPVYRPFRLAVENNGRRLIQNTLVNQGGYYRMDLESLESQIDDQTRLLILCSPHNPVSRVWRAEELKELVNLCFNRGIIIISDEIHADLIMPGFTHLPTSQISSEAAEITVTCTAPNKTFNIAGLEMGNAIIPNHRLRARFQQALLKAGLFLANTFGVVATEVAYREGEKWLTAVINYIHQNYLFLQEYFGHYLPEIKITPLEGTYLAWLDFRAFHLSDKELQEKLLRKAKVWLDEGPKFGQGGQGFQRLNLACPRGLLEEALERIVKAFRS